MSANIQSAAKLINATFSDITKVDYCPVYEVTKGNRTITISSTNDNKKTHYMAYPANFIDDNGNECRPSETRPKSNFNRETESSRLSKVLTRLFSEFESHWVESEKIQTYRNEYNEKRLQAIDIVGLEHLTKNCNNEDYRITGLDSGYGSVQIYGDSVNIDIHNISAEKARKILDVLFA